MAPTLITSYDVPVAMEISTEKNDKEILTSELSSDECDIESTIVISGGQLLKETLNTNKENIEEVSSEIITIFDNEEDNTDYSMLSSVQGQNILSVDELGCSSFETFPLLDVKDDGASDDGGDWSEVGETLELSDDVEEEIAVENEADQQTISHEDLLTEASLERQDFCIVIDGQAYNIITTNPILVAQTEEESTDETQGELLLEPKKVPSTKKRKLIQQKRKYPCIEPGCGRSYTTQARLKVHVHKHLGLRPYPCPVDDCSKTFGDTYNRSVHIRTHTGEKPYKCAVCSKCFKISGDLLKHTRIHTGERPFKCPVEGCDKAFTTADIRKIHIRSHTGEKPYVCNAPGCERRFSSSTNCKNHIRTHTGEKPFVCPVEGCTSRFSEYSTLYKHRNVHKQKVHPLENWPSFRVSSHLPLKTASRNGQNSVKKPEKLSKEITNSTLSLQNDESNLDCDTLGMNSEEDNFEIYQLILTDNLTM